MRVLIRVTKQPHHMHYKISCTSQVEQQNILINSVKIDTSRVAHNGIIVLVN